MGAPRHSCAARGVGRVPRPAAAAARDRSPAPRDSPAARLASDVGLTVLSLFRANLAPRFDFGDADEEGAHPDLAELVAPTVADFLQGVGDVGEHGASLLHLAAVVRYTSARTKSRVLRDLDVFRRLAGALEQAGGAAGSAADARLAPLLTLCAAAIEGCAGSPGPEFRMSGGMVAGLVRVCLARGDGGGRTARNPELASFVLAALCRVDEGNTTLLRGRWGELLRVWLYGAEAERSNAKILAFQLVLGLTCGGWSVRDTRAEKLPHLFDGEEDCASWRQLCEMSS